MEDFVTVHVTLTRHSCMGAFSIWMKSLGQNNHGFVSWQFCRELNLEQNGQASSYGDRVYLQKECTCTLRNEKREKCHCYGNKVCTKKSQSRWCLLLDLQIVKVNVVYFWHLKQYLYIAKSAYRSTTTYRYHTTAAHWPRRSRLLTENEVAECIVI